MSQIADASYIGKGEIFLGPYSGGSAIVSVGNVAELTFSHGTEKKEQKDYTSAGGGNANTLERITGVTMNMKAYDVNAYNLSVGAFGTSAAVTAAAVTTELHVGYKGGLVPFTFVPNLAIAPVVKDQTGTTTYTVGTDYVLTQAGIYITTGSTIPNSVGSANNLSIGYTKLAVNVVQALVASAQEYKMIFSGLNEAQSGKAVVITVHRFKPGPAQNISYLGDDYASLDLPGEALSDALITGAGLSKFYTVAFA